MINSPTFVVALRMMMMMMMKRTMTMRRRRMTKRTNHLLLDSIMEVENIFVSWVVNNCVDQLS
jgi:hypothetical protein